MGREHYLHVAYVAVVLHPENNDNLRVGGNRSKVGKITIAVEDYPVESALEMPVIPLLDAPVVISLGVGYRHPAIFTGPGQTSVHAHGGFPVCAIKHLRKNSHVKE